MQQQKKPDPAEILAQIEAQKAQVDMRIAQDKMRLEWEKSKLSDDRERDRLDADIALRAAEIFGKYQTTVDVAQIKADIDRDREAMRQVQDATRQQIMGPGSSPVPPPSPPPPPGFDLDPALEPQVTGDPYKNTWEATAEQRWNADVDR